MDQKDRQKQTWLCQYSGFYICTPSHHLCPAMQPTLPPLCYLRPPSHQTSKKMLIQGTTSHHSFICLYHQLPLSHTVLIHGLHVSKPSLHSLYPSTCQHPFVPDLLCIWSFLTFYSCQPYQTSQALNFKHIHFFLSALPVLLIWPSQQYC